MDERLEAYFLEPNIEAPHMSSARIARELEKRERKHYIALLALASLLWTMTAIITAVRLRAINHAASLWVLITLCVCLACSGLFSLAILKTRKAELKNGIS